MAKERAGDFLNGKNETSECTDPPKMGSLPKPREATTEVDGFGDPGRMGEYDPKENKKGY